MKKTLLLIGTIVLSVFALNAQKTWNFSTFTAETFTSEKIIDGLKIMASSDGSVIIDANNKTNGSYSFTQRLKLGGAGLPTTENPFMPTTRSLVFNVTGPGTITVACLSSSSSANRRLILTNGTDSISGFDAPGSYSADGNNIPVTTFEYTGAATTLYLYSVSSGVNIYLLDVTSGTNISASQVENPLSDKGITFNGSEITNTKGLEVEVYNALGKRITSSKSSIATNNFQKGMYIVRIAGTSNVLKIMI